MDDRQALQIGTVVDGKYRIERILESGGFGIVYEALDIELDTLVVLKELFPYQLAVRDSALGVRPRSESDRDNLYRLGSSFLREARTLNRFEHPAMPRILAVFEAHGTAYMVMKYETGPSLESWLAELGREPLQEELDRLVAPLVSLLEEMHNESFLHRDIAPANIIVRSDGGPVLLNFGAARRFKGEQSGSLTVVVRKGYSPPEQYAADGRSQGPWTDIYALGATLYRCIAGAAPEEASQRVIEDCLVSAVERGGDRYRAGFLAAIDAAMSMRPAARPLSIAEWRAMLLEG
jgi:serine/threonine protein kinase